MLIKDVKEAAIFLERLSERLVLLGLTTRISDDSWWSNDKVVDLDWCELKHKEIGWDLMFFNNLRFVLLEHV